VAVTIVVVITSCR